MGEGRVLPVHVLLSSSPLWDVLAILGIQPYGQCISEYTGERKRRQVPAGWGPDQGLGATCRILDDGSGPHILLSGSPGPPRRARMESLGGVRSVLLCWDDARIEEHSVLRERSLAGTEIELKRTRWRGPGLGNPTTYLGKRGPQKQLFTCPQCPGRTDEDHWGTVSSRLCVSDSGNVEC